MLLRHLPFLQSRGTKNVPGHSKNSTSLHLKFRMIQRLLAPALALLLLSSSFAWTEPRTRELAPTPMMVAETQLLVSMLERLHFAERPLSRRISGEAGKESFEFTSSSDPEKRQKTLVPSGAAELISGAPPEGVDARGIQPFYTGLLARLTGMDIKIGIEDERGEGDACECDSGWREVAQPDLDEHVGRAPERGQRQHEEPGATVHPSRVATRPGSAIRLCDCRYRLP
jgi:hypothetical protein